MSSRILRYDILMLVQIVGGVILVASLFYSGLSMITIFGGALIFLSITGIAVAALRSERESESATATEQQTAAERSEP